MEQTPSPTMLATAHSASPVPARCRSTFARIIAAVAVMTMFMAHCTAVQLPPGSNFPTGNRPFFIVSRVSGLVLDVANGNAILGSELILSTRRPGVDPNQMWTYDGSHIRNAKFGPAASITVTRPGIPVTMQPTTTNPGQIFSCSVPFINFPPSPSVVLGLLGPAQPGTRVGLVTRSPSPVELWDIFY